VSGEDEVREGDKVDFALNLLKRNKKRKISAESKYIDLT
jgi:ribosomal protein S21